MANSPVCQTVSTTEYTEAAGISRTEVQKRITSGELPAINTGANGVIRIWKGNTPGYDTERELIYDSELLTIEETCELLGFSADSLRKLIKTTAGQAVDIVPDGRTWKVTQASIKRLLGSYDFWIWEEPPAPKPEPMIAPANATVALEVLPEIRSMVKTLQIAIDGLAVWLEKLSELEPKPIQLPIDEGEAVTGSAELFREDMGS